MVHRLFSVDVVMVLLEQPERQPEELEDPDFACFLPHKFLVKNLLFPRRIDSSPTVQSHAMACLGHCLELQSFNATQAVHSLFSPSENSLLMCRELCQFLYFSKCLMSAPAILNFSSLYLAGIQTVLDAEFTDGILLFLLVSLRQQRVILQDKTHLKCFSCAVFLLAALLQLQ